ncbi:MAG: acyl--CoA ligase [Chloroflexota bacterium]|nr:acyl--CoA ligase [Chloroflexota bacterium]
MSFATQLDATARSSASQSNILTDGQFTVSYAALPGLLPTFADYFARHGIERKACLAVECPNSVPGALTLLYLFQQEMSFVLLPPSEQGEQSSEWKPVSYFCQYRLVVKRASADSDETWAHHPDDFLLLEANPDYQPHFSLDLDAPGYLYLRTSGSMGASKLVVHTHTTMLNNAQGCVTEYRYTSADRLALPVPIAHMYGLGVGFLPAILAGASIDFVDQTNLFRYLAHEKNFNPTVALVTPTLVGILLKGFQTPRHYRLGITATQRIPEDAFRDFDAAIGGCFVNQLGSSEMGAIAVCAPEDDLAYKATTIGKPLPGVQLKVDENDELYCQHPAGFIGYVDERGQWLQRQTPNDWFRTGDMARRLPNGYFQITGRAGNSMNRRGYLVQFADIERQMEQIPGIVQVIVVGNGNTERITAYCVLRNQQLLTESHIREKCFERLPHYAIPDAVLLLDALPLLPTGKVDRQRLTSMAR